MWMAALTRAQRQKVKKDENWVVPTWEIINCKLSLKKSELEDEKYEKFWYETKKVFNILKKYLKMRSLGVIFSCHIFYCIF